MQFSYTNTIDDLREAARANGNIYIDVHFLAWWAVFGLLLQVPLAALGAIGSSTLPAGARALLTLAAVVVPAAAGITLYVAVGWRGLRNLHDPRAPGVLLKHGGWAVAVALAALHVYLAWQQSTNLQRQPPATGEPVPSTMQLLRAPLIWTAVFAGLGVVLMWFNRAVINRMWTGDPDLQRTQLVVVADTGVAAGNPFGRTEYGWPAFLRVRETRNLFLLYVARYRYLMVPKRALAEAGVLEEFRTTVQSKVSAATAPAFAVGPPAPWPVPAPIAGGPTPAFPTAPFAPPASAIPFAAVAPQAPGPERPPPLSQR